MPTSTSHLGMATPYWELIGKSDSDLRAELSDYADMNVSMVRLDFYWSNIERTSGGGFDFSRLDTVIDMAAEYDIEVLGLLNHHPNWTPGTFRSAWEREAFGRFSAATVEHFQDRVNVWEIYNEQNLHGIAPDDYAELLKVAYAAIKEQDADSFVITGGTAAVPSTKNGLWGAVDYLEKMYAAGAKGSFDAVGFHPYTFPLMPEDPASWNGWQILEDGIRSTMVANGDADKQVWITELGAPTAGGGNAVDKAEQVQILNQAMNMAADYDWVGPVLWYSYQDRGGSGSDTENWFGLLGPDGTRKPAYYEFKRLAELMNGDAGTDAPASEPSEPEDDTPVTPEDDTPVTPKEDSAEIVADIAGGPGDDLIVDTPGQTSMSGGGGRDTFAFSRGGEWNLITDFAPDDVIDLSGIDADLTRDGHQSFELIGSEWLGGPGEVGVYLDATHDRTYVQARVSGDAAEDVHVVLEGIHDLSAPNFDLYRRIIEGGDGKDRLTGDAGDNLIQGAGGADILAGGAGDDTLMGGSGRDVLRGNKGDDVLDGGTGNDKLIGGPGHDTFVIAQAGDRDTITDFRVGDIIDLSRVDADAERDGHQSFEFVGSDWLEGPAEVGVYQNAGRNKTYVEASTFGDQPDLRVVLKGIHDITEEDLLLHRRDIVGTSQDDVLEGNAGDNVIAGGEGDDVLTGGAGADTFVFSDPQSMGRDRITDFGSGDRIDLSGIDGNVGLAGKQSLGFIGSAWLESPGDLGVYHDHSNSLTYVQGDTDGGGIFDFSILLNGVHELSVDDFIL